VLGGAGFIANTLIFELLASGKTVVAVDSLIRGSQKYLDRFTYSDRFAFIKKDLADRTECTAAFDFAAKFGEIEEVWHLAANSDIPAGVANSDIDIRDTFQTTSEILKAMKVKGAKNLYFASSSAIYGDLGDRVLHEEIGPLLPISNYGAMKLASEALISAAAEDYLNRVCIFRFPNVVGIPATHGVIFDFVNKLKINSASLEVLGNGTQQKSYLHASDLVSAMCTVSARKCDPKVNVLNIGPIDEGVTVKWIAEQVVKRVSPQAAIHYGLGNKGWVGDVPKFNYSTDKLQSYGWRPKLRSDGAIVRAVDEIATQLGC
jgi:UDP-glucose 4-epimerase